MRNGTWTGAVSKKSVPIRWAYLAEAGGMDMEEQFMIKGMPTGIRFLEEKKEYGIDPRLLVWVKNNVEGCPQTLEEFARITRLDRWKVNRSKSTRGYERPSWLVERRGDFSIIGEMRDLQYLLLQEIEIDDFSFLSRCRKLQVLDLQHTNFSDCSLLTGLTELKKVYLPPRSQMIHTEVLDRILNQTEAPSIQVPEPFYRDEDFRNMKIVDAGSVRLSYEGNCEVRCVQVDFAGKEPSAWKHFEYEEEDCWADLNDTDKEIMADQLADAIAGGRVHSFLLSQEPWGEGHYLSGEFAGGWAAVFYDTGDGEAGYSIYNADYDTVEILAPVEIGGQSPVPKMMAVEDMELVAKIARHFLKTGQLCPGTRWLKDGDEDEEEKESAAKTDELPSMDEEGSFIAYCGIEIIPEEQGCFTRVRVEPKHHNPYGIVHGGLLYTMADTAAGYTAKKLTPSPVTLNSEFHYMGNTPSGVLTARTEVLKAGRHILLIRVRVLADEELLLAEGTFTYYSDGKDHDIHM